MKAEAEMKETIKTTQLPQYEWNDHPQREKNV